MRKEKERGLCTAIALYDLDVANINLKGLFKWAEGWFKKTGYSPVRASLDAQDIKSTKTATYAHCKRVAEKRNFEGLTGFWLAHTPPNHRDDSFDALLMTALSTSQDIRAKDFRFYFHHSIMPHSWEYCEALVQEIAAFVPCSYGIAYQRDLIKGPSFYSLGMDAGTVSDFTPEGLAEGDRIACWFHKYNDPKYWHIGMLRDIYPLNFLSKAHLENQIKGLPFDQWVAADPVRGTLKPLTNSMWSWRVEEDNISTIREALRPTGLVLCI